MLFADKIRSISKEPVKSDGIDILQVNLGYRCNLSCKHCHVNGGPDRDEVMNKETMDDIASIAESVNIEAVDITGGAPELNPYFRYFVNSLRGKCRKIICRTNLTVFSMDGMDGLHDFYRDNEVELIASLPYYIEENVDRVRGNGTFKKSIDALKSLNHKGYGIDATGLRLDFVYNPQGAFIPPSQDSLEPEYKKELLRLYGITFNNLYTFVNMPIGRFKDFLIKTNNYEKYLDKLKSAFNECTLTGLMCRKVLNIRWDGMIYDCDFNQMAGLNILRKYPQHINEFDYESLSNREIAIGDHCYGCTAGQGST